MQWLWVVAAVFAALGAICAWLAIAARRASRRLQEHATRLQSEPHSAKRAQPQVYHESQLASEPPTVIRYHSWTLDDGTSPARAARIRMAGRIRLGRGKPWMTHRSEEIIRAGEGFIWSAKVSGSLPIVGADQYIDRQGNMQWRLCGMIPIVNASGDNITRSSRWRFAAEHLLIPGALLPGRNVRWTSTNDLHANLEVDVDGIAHPMTIEFHAEGMPRKISFERWGNFETNDGTWRHIPYSVRCQGVFRKDGYSLPHLFTASWWADTDKELAVVELEIEDAQFF